VGIIEEQKCVRCLTSYEVRWRSCARPWWNNLAVLGRNRSHPQEWGEDSGVSDAERRINGGSARWNELVGYMSGLSDLLPPIQYDNTMLPVPITYWACHWSNIVCSETDVMSILPLKC